MTVNQMLPRPSAHIAAEVDGISKDQIVVTGGAFVSGTVLGKLKNGKYTQLKISADADEANEAVGVLFGHVQASDNDEPAAMHSRVSALYESKLTWPEGISADQKTKAISKLAENHIVMR